MEEQPHRLHFGGAKVPSQCGQESRENQGHQQILSANSASTSDFKFEIMGWGLPYMISKGIGCVLDPIGGGV